MPNRTTRDYEGPAVAPTLQAVLESALRGEDDLTLDARYVICIAIMIFRSNAIECYLEKIATQVL